MINEIINPYFEEPACSCCSGAYLTLVLFFSSVSRAHIFLWLMKMLYE